MTLLSLTQVVAVLAGINPVECPLFTGHPPAQEKRELRVIKVNLILIRIKNTQNDQNRSLCLAPFVMDLMMRR